MIDKETKEMAKRIVAALEGDSTDCLSAYIQGYAAFDAFSLRQVGLSCFGIHCSACPLNLRVYRQLAEGKVTTAHHQDE